MAAMTVFEDVRRRARYRLASGSSPTVPCAVLGLGRGRRGAVRCSRDTGRPHLMDIVRA